MQVIHSTDNPYGGTHVTSDDLPQDNAQCIAALADSLQIWQQHGVKVVWLNLRNERAPLLADLYQLGFTNHHCNAEALMLTKALQPGAVIPPFAKHTIGVGGVVINAQQQLLTIREKAHIEKYPHLWKFPGGMLDPYEHLADGVKREVLEETGVICDFANLIGFRHHHQGQFSTSNIYAVCRLNPLSVEIVIQESEIADARWFPVADYLNDEKISQFNKSMVRRAIENSGLQSVKLPGYMQAEYDYEIFI